MNDQSLLARGVLERFRREAQVASKLDHPGICPVLEARADKATPYIVMRYLEGETLAGRIASSREMPSTEGASGPVELRIASLAEGGEERGEIDPTPTPSGPTSRADVMEVVWLIEQAARALHAAHEAGIIHRDVKPANIMVSAQGNPVMMDFGLAKSTRAARERRLLSGAAAPSFRSRRCGLATSAIEPPCW